MELEAPNNCWPVNLQSFADAAVASPTFRTLVSLPAGPDDEVAKLVFGKRLRISRSGYAWTADELAQQRAYAMVFSDPSRPFGLHLVNNARYSPHGTVCVALGRLVPAADLVDASTTSTGLTELHDRQWQNIVGTFITDILAWLPENGGPYPVPMVDITDDHESKASNSPTEGVWQYSEVTFQYNVE